MSDPDKLSKAAEEINANVKTAFDKVANEELPDRFKDLLDTLRSQSSSDAASQGAQDDS
ncbi:MAG: NepR family anti-sigma factor [Pseudomonadota bacterium]